ncbi:MAG: ribosome biogenesis GTPase Der [Spirochaetales bacterium]|nr:ribosome biogenesis GTPase Der [Spirochaetales bacterium]
MKALPKVALLGKRNAGKSSLFNLLLGKHRALTDDFSGLTRDILAGEVERDGKRFLLHDLPGLDLPPEEELTPTILERARAALEGMDALIVLFDGFPSGFEYNLIARFRKDRKIPVVYVLNKVDQPESAGALLEEYQRQGLEVIPVSVKSRYNVGAVTEALYTVIHAREGREARQKSHSSFSDTESQDLTIAIVGKPNAGKSSLLNALTNKELALVSEIPGTTRDSIDSLFRWRGKRIRIIDTAGIRRPKYLRSDAARPDRLSYTRTTRAIEAADIVILLMDASTQITDQDKKIAGLVQKQKKASIIAFNKWDTVSRNTDTMKETTADFRSRFPAMDHSPLLYISARTGQRLQKLLEECFALHERYSIRIPTAALNTDVQRWSKQIRAGRVMYVTQAEKTPPAFIFFVKNADHFRPEHRKFFENKIRETYHLEGVPLKLFFREDRS